MKNTPPQRLFVKESGHILALVHVPIRVCEAWGRVLFCHIWGIGVSDVQSLAFSYDAADRITHIGTSGSGLEW